jgi:uncharacterized protein YabE (DUF348 family)
VAVVLITAGVLLAVTATAGGAAAEAGHTIRVDASGTLVNNATGAAALVGVIHEAFQPAHISVWMNERGETR